MKKLGIIGVGVALVLLCLVGSEGSVAQASADFFGICLLDESKPLESLWDVTRNENGGVSYRHNSSLADPRIHCWGYINSDIRLRYRSAPLRGAPIPFGDGYIWP